MTFRVIIQQTVEVERKRTTQYEIVADTGGPDGGTKREWLQPPDKKISEETENIYEQRIEELDLLRVIKAVNGAD